MHTCNITVQQYVSIEITVLNFAYEKHIQPKKHYLKSFVEYIKPHQLPTIIDEDMNHFQI